MDLSIVSSDKPLQVCLSDPLGLQVSSNTKGVYGMRFRLAKLMYPLVFGNISVCHTNIRVSGLEPVVHRPSHNPHESGITKRRAANHFQFDFSLVQQLVTGFT